MLVCIILLQKYFFSFDKNTNFSLENDVFPLLAYKGILSAIKIDTKFIDIGIPEDYSKFFVNG